MGVYGAALQGPSGFPERGGLFAHVAAGPGFRVSRAAAGRISVLPRPRVEGVVARGGLHAHGSRIPRSGLQSPLRTTREPGCTEWEREAIGSGAKSNGLSFAAKLL